MLGAIWLIFTLDQNLELLAETLVLHSGPKFLCFVVYFPKYFWFWYQTEILSEKVYAVIWPVLEITSLKVFHYKISITRNDLVIKMRISRRIYNLGFAKVAKSAFESHFPNSIIPGKRKIYSVKNFCSQ